MTPLAGSPDRLPLSAVEYETVLAALADVVVEEELGTRAVTVRVGLGLPDGLIPRQQPAMFEWWASRVAPDQRDRVVAGVRSVGPDGQDSWMDEYDLRWSDDSMLHIVHRCLLLRAADGSPQRLVHVFQDATARRQANERLAAERDELERRVAERTHAIAQKNSELARAMRHKDEFLASMSHELRTPLNAVLGLTDAMLEGIGGQPNERHSAWLADIRASGKHLLGLINDILDLARVESGKLELDLQRVAPADAAEHARRLVAGSALAAGVSLDAHVADGLPALQTDPRLLRQILLNLLGNAIKFTPKGGRVRFVVMPGEACGTVSFEVSDTGIGIPPERLADIFQPFVQVDGGLDRQAGGTGLGLALVARMAERLGGSVKVESIVGVGSSFTVTLPSIGVAPRDSAEVPVIIEEDPSVASPRQLRVLLAEDNPANVRTFSEYLTAKGLQLEIVGDGLAAVETARAVMPDVILMDVQMPHMDGLQATRTLRADPRTARIPIIALTALAMPGDRERCLEAGANVYLAKPVRLRELVNHIRDLAAQPYAP